MSKDLNDKAQAGELPDDPALNARSLIADVPRVLTVRDLMKGAQKRANSPQEGRGCPTGHYELDGVTGGLKRGFVWVFGADTSWGKSSFLVMLADECIKARKRVLIVSAEDSEKIYGDRLLLRRSRISADNLRKRKLSKEEHERVAEALRKAEDVPVFLDARGRGVEWICGQVKRLIKEHGIDVVAYDYLQAFDNEKRQQDRRNQISYIARVLTDSAKTSDVAGIIFSQITVQEGKSHPDKHSIRESRDVSNAAEVVMLGFTPEKDVTRKSDGRVIVAAGQKAVLVDKCKDGPRGGLYAMNWNAESACFDTVYDPEAERIAAAAAEWDGVGDDYSPPYGDSF
jgi:replicative DNA helicase